MGGESSVMLMGTCHTVREAARAATTMASAFAVHSSLRFRPSARHRLHGVDDRLISGAAAIIAGEMRADLLAARNAAARQQFLRGQQHARRTVAALQRVARDECLLQIGDLVGIGHSLDGLDASAVALYGEHQAAAYNHSVNAHAAGTADAVLATDVTAGERKLLAQKIDQCLARIDAFAHLLTVDDDRDLVEAPAHDGARPSCRATRRSSTPAR